MINELNNPYVFNKLKIIEKELIDFRIYNLKINEYDFYEYGLINLTFEHNNLKFKNSIGYIDVFINNLNENHIAYEIIKMVAHLKLKGDNDN